MSESNGPDVERISCKIAARLMSAKHDRVLTGEESASLEWHLMRCLNCARFDKQLDFLHRLAERYGKDGPPDDDPT